MPCLAVPEIHDFVTGRLDATSVARVDEHLDGCQLCREIVAGAGTALSDSESDPGASAQLLMPAGTLLDRFEIEEVIGRGAMGVVYRARDPRLDRRVALKLLRADRESSTKSHDLVLEAQSMARLSHPNVVAVYDVGPVAQGEDEFYVAMELVEGVTLREWLAAEGRSWREVVEVLAAAGQGLAAAHDAGICHRDFKPENVIVGNDGRARVTDFGLARAGSARHLQGASLEQTLTNASGTPAYMAPEIFSGAAATEKSDQFSFCVTLFEALYGCRPFAGEGMEALIAEVSAGDISWPKTPTLPGWLERVLSRGLCRDPDERFGSMAVLLSRLQKKSRGRRRMVGAAVAGAMVAGLAVTLAMGSSDRAGRNPCGDTIGDLEAAFSPERQSRLESALARAGSEVSEKTLAAVKRFTSRWEHMRIDSCRATHERHEQSGELLDLRTQCLDRRLHELVLLQEQIAEATSEQLVNAPLWADALGDLRHCGDAEGLRTGIRPADAKMRDLITPIQSELDRVALMIDATGVEEAKSLAEELVEASRSLGHEPLIGESLQVLASALIESGELERADAALTEALQHASMAQDHMRVADLSNTRILLVGIRQQKFEAALALIPAAEAAVAQAGRDPLRVANLHINAGAVYDMAGKRDEAQRELLTALELFRGMPGHSAEIASALHNLAVQAMESGDRELARTRYEESLALREEVFGASHPLVAQSSLGLGALARRNDELAAARKHYERAEHIYRQVFGADYAGLGAVYNNLAIVCVSEKDYAAAEKNHLRALEIRKSEYGDKHPLVAQSLSGLGNLFLATGRIDEALVSHSNSLKLRQQVYPPEHPSLAIGIHGYAGALSAHGKFRDAVVQRREALRIFEAIGADEADLAEMQFELAKDLWRLKAAEHRREALALAREAGARLDRAGLDSTEQAAEIDLWLAERL